MIFTADRLRKAREQGYSDDEIWDHLSSDDRFNKAKQQGYGLDEIASYFDAQQAAQPASSAQPVRKPFDANRFFPKMEEQVKVEKEVGTVEGIVNAAKNAYASSMQALDVVGGVTPEEAKNISRIEYEKEARKVAPDYEAYQKAEGWDAVWAFVTNPIEVTSNIIAEGLAGSIPALGAGLATGGVGAAAGSVVPVVGTAAGFTAGQVAGTFAGSLATEYGSKVLEELQNEGMDIKDPESIQRFFADQESVDAARDKALKKGVPIAAFDAVSAGVGGKIARLTGKKFLTKTGEAAAEVGVQAGLGGGGEVVGSLAAGDEIDPKAVFAEVIGEVGTGSVEIVTGRIADRNARLKAQEDKKIKDAATLADTLEQNDAPLTANVIKSEAATSIEQDKLAKQLADELDLEELTQPPAATEKRATEAPSATTTPLTTAVTEQIVPAQPAAPSDRVDVVPEELSMPAKEYVSKRKAEGATAQQAAAELKKIRDDWYAKNDLPEGSKIQDDNGNVWTKRNDGLWESQDGFVKPGIEPLAGSKILRRGYKASTQVEQVVTPTQPAAPAAQPPPTDATQEILQQESLRPEPQDRVEIGETEGAIPSDSIPTPEGSEAQGQVINDLQSVADNTANREQISALSAAGLVDIIKGQPVINEDGEAILAQAQAPLPALTPEERVAEIEGAPPAEAPAIVEQAPVVSEEGALVSEVTPEQRTTSLDERFPAAPNVVDGRIVREEIPNEASIESSLTDYEVLPDVREVQMSEFELSGKSYSVAGDERIAELANQIQASKEINPLIVVVDSNPDGPYILEGSTRAQALQRIGAKSFPAKIVIDKESFQDSFEANDPVLASVVEEYNIELPDGYIKDGEFYVYRQPAEPTISEIPQTSEIVSPATAEPALVEAEAEVGPAELDADTIIGIRSGVANADPDMRELWAMQLSARLEKKGSLTWRDIPQDLSDSMTTVEFGALKNAIATNPQAAIDLIEGKATQPATPAPAPTIGEKPPTSPMIGAEPTQPAPAEGVAEPSRAVTPAPETAAEPAVVPEREGAPTPEVPLEAQPEGIVVGNRIKLGRSPQTYTIEEVIPQTATEQELGEQYYSVRNEKTGEVQVVEKNDMKPVKGKGARRMAAEGRAEKVTPVAESDRYGFEESVIETNKIFGGEIPPNFAIITDPTNKEFEFKAAYDPNDGMVIVNLAFIRKGENLQDIISHELGHYRRRRSKSAPSCR
jgi:hypothetical protein